MLTELSVENFALVDRLRLHFAAGLNLLTGETGAGKSILLDALGMALGGRTGTEVVRHGADKARVEAVFTISDGDKRVHDALETAGVETEDGLLLLSRELSAAGKSAARINGRPATVAMLKAVGDALVDIHGQHEHQSLLSVERHGEILDAWCGVKAEALLETVAAAFAKARDAERELSELRQDARERARNIDLLAFQCEEIDNASLKPDEEDDLIAERLQLGSAEKRFASAAGAYSALRGGEGGVIGALTNLSTAIGEVEFASRLDEALQPILETLQTALFQAEDAAQELRTYRDGIEFNSDRLEEIETRLELLKTLKRKYGESIPEIIAYREEIGTRLESLENAEERIAGLDAAVARTKTALAAAAAKLTEARRKAAGPFANAIRKELSDLAMSATQFVVSIEPRAEPTARGADQIEFLISPNPGEPLKPLAKIASGGEISRVMLAMKSVLARILAVPTLIFDEIDTGIGGRTGTVLAEKLSTLSSTSQILCITHLPQIAARGGTHFFIEKRTEKGRTSVHVAPLGTQQRVEELARMLGGHNSETVLQHAREMLGE